jgi:hypothetical protein
MEIKGRYLRATFLTAEKQPSQALNTFFVAPFLSLPGPSGLTRGRYRRARAPIANSCIHFFGLLHSANECSTFGLCLGTSRPHLRDAASFATGPQASSQTASLAFAASWAAALYTIVASVCILW